jgi:hypothetical protein
MLIFVVGFIKLIIVLANNYLSITLNTCHGTKSDQFVADYESFVRSAKAFTKLHAMPTTNGPLNDEAHANKKKSERSQVNGEGRGAAEELDGEFSPMQKKKPSQSHTDEKSTNVPIFTEVNDHRMSKQTESLIIPVEGRKLTINEEKKNQQMSPPNSLKEGINGDDDGDEDDVISSIPNQSMSVMPTIREDSKSKTTSSTTSKSLSAGEFRHPIMSTFESPSPSSSSSSPNAAPPKVTAKRVGLSLGIPKKTS